MSSDATTGNPANAPLSSGGGDIINRNIVYNQNHKRPVKSWARGIIVRQACHSKLATLYMGRDRILNTVSVTLTALSSSAIFATINPTVDDSLGSVPGGKAIFTFGAGIIAVVSTVLQAVMKALQYAALAEQHRLASRQFTRLRFRLEIIVGDNLEDDGYLNMEKLAEWTREYEDLLESAPVIPQDIFVKHMEKEVKKRKKRLEELREMEMDGIASSVINERTSLRTSMVV